MIKLSGRLRYTDADINQNTLQAENVLAAFFNGPYMRIRDVKRIFSGLEKNVNQILWGV